MMRQGISFFIFLASIFFYQLDAVAQSKQPTSGRRGSMPTIPDGAAGIRGSAGLGFTDFTVVDPSDNFKMDRGAFSAVAIERGFDVMNLYFTVTISYMGAEGRANYKYVNSSTGVTYAANNVNFKANLFDLSLGFKLKLIDHYWFGPYIEGGGMGSFHEVIYTTKLDTLESFGPDWKRKDTIMGSGGYAETGIEVNFTEKFGLKFAGRFTDQRSKEVETLNKVKMNLRTETYYFSALFGF